jgi:hypothetical protein
VPIVEAIATLKAAKQRSEAEGGPSAQVWAAAHKGIVTLASALRDLSLSKPTFPLSLHLLFKLKKTGCPVRRRPSCMVE